MGQDNEVYWPFWRETVVTVHFGDLGHLRQFLGKDAKTATRSLIGGSAFHFLFLGGVGWFVTGCYLDSWAHNNVPRLETFFTPWHSVLYSGLFVISVLLSIAILLNLMRGASWWTAIPRGYELSTFFVFMMFFVGVSDAVWHTLFGIEKNVDGLLSPTHIAGMLFSGIIILGPYRALSTYKRDLSKTEQLILTLTITLFLALLAVLTQLTTIYTRLWPLTVPNTYTDGQLLAVVSFVFQGLLLTGVALVTLRRWPLPVGLFTCALTIIAIGMSFMKGQYLVDILTGVISGLLLDISYQCLQPSSQRALQLRLFAMITACVMPAVYLLVVWLTVGPLIWSVHLLIGSVAVCAIFGWLLSYVAILPAPQTEA